MSTYWYFECLDHDPPLSSKEFTQHTDDPPYKRAIELALNRPIPEDWWDRRSLSDDSFAANACRFLGGHPRCNLGLVNEYGEHRALVKASADDRPAYERCGACRDLGGEHTRANDCRFRPEPSASSTGDGRA